MPAIAALAGAFTLGAGAGLGLSARTSEHDLAAATAAIEAERSKTGQDDARPAPSFGSVVRQLAALRDADSIITILGEAGDDRDIRRAAMLRWAELDPRGALSFIFGKAAAGEHAGAWFYRDVFRVWGEIDSGAAFEYCRTLGDIDLIAGAAESALDGAARANPDQAFALYFQIRKSLPADTGYSMGGWLVENPQVAAPLILKHGPRDEWGENVRANLLSIWAEADPDAATAWVRANLSELTSNDLAHFSQAMSARDAAGAAEFFSSLPRELRHAGDAGALAAELAKSDPAGALVWLDERLSGHAKTQAVNRMLESWAAADPAAAAPLVAEFGTGSDPSGNIVRSLMRKWVRSDADAAWTWLSGLDAGRLRENGVKEFGHAMASRSLGSVQGFMDEAGLSENDEKAMLLGAYEAFPWDGHEGGLAWLRQLSESKAAHVVGAAFGRFASDDVVVAAETAAEMESPLLREKAAVAVARQASYRAPERLAEWISRQPDSTVREMFLNALGDPSIPADVAERTLERVRFAGAE